MGQCDLEDLKDQLVRLEPKGQQDLEVVEDQQVHEGHLDVEDLEGLKEDLGIQELRGQRVLMVN